MPVRKIPKNYNYVTGGFASRKRTSMAGYESPLEHEFMLLLEFDPEVETFEEQPIRIWFEGETGRKKSYVPDIFVRFRNAPPQLIEIKTTADLKKNEQRYALKFAAARFHAEEQGWKFRIVTEKDIRGPYLQNLKFLREYREIETDPKVEQSAIEILSSVARGMSVSSLLHKLATSDQEKLIVLPVIWHLVVSRQIQANLAKELTYQTRLSVPVGRP